MYFFLLYLCLPILCDCILFLFFFSDHENTVTTCLESGKWRSINVTCIAAASFNFIHQQEQTKALEDLQLENSSPKMVIALAIVASILASGVIVFGMLLLRRRLLSGPSGSLSPLIYFIDKNNSSSSRNGASNQNNDSQKYRDAPKKINNVQYQNNLIQSTAHGHHKIQTNKTHSDEASHECSYEKIEEDHSYETLRQKTKTSPTITSLIHGEKLNNYENQKGSDSDPGYEAVRSEPKSSYETEEQQCETKDPGYEVVQEPNYEVVENSKTKIIHGYETLKPKLPPRSNTSTESLQQDRSLNVSPEILALYAKVDKSKKSTKRSTELDSVYSTKNVVQKFNSLTSLDDDNFSRSCSPSPPASISSSDRPLPPIPNQS